MAGVVALPSLLVSPWTESSLREVKMMGLPAVPLATSVPWPESRVADWSSLMTAPGSMVSVTPELTVTPSLEMTYGLWAAVQVVSEVILPLTSVVAAANLGATKKTPKNMAAVNTDLIARGIKDDCMKNQ